MKAELTVKLYKYKFPLSTMNLITIKPASNTSSLVILLGPTFIDTLQC